MTKFLALLLLGVCLSIASFASHFKGGWIQYTYIGPGAAPGTSQFQITVHQYFICPGDNNGVDRLEPTVDLSIYNLDSTTAKSLDTTINISVTASPSYSEILSKTTFDKCINNPPDVCYEIGHYTTTIDLPDNVNGYALSAGSCCRIDGIVNILNSLTAGMAYTTTIFGSAVGAPFFPNNSAVFQQQDTALICHNLPFIFDFSASDPDGDSLAYSFTEGLNTVTQGTNLLSVNYALGYTSQTPMGPGVTINSATGMVSGIAPNAIGTYVVAVVVSEYRLGQLVGMTRKELHITVADCSISATALNPVYLNCDDLKFTFTNQSTASNIVDYLWTFGDTLLPYINDTSHQPIAIHTYSDSGVYNLKLVVTTAFGCKDSTVALIKAYPGFQAGFSVTGTCVTNPYQFTDTSHYKYGVVTSWQWDFGEPSVTTDVSRKQDTVYTYPQTGSKTITLTVGSDRGCTSTATYTLNVIPPPTLTLGFKDTLICDVNTIQLLSTTGPGTVAWTAIPDNNSISQPNTNNPTVFPKDTTKYAVQASYSGCQTNDTVTVNVLPYVPVTIRPDTIVCQTDSFHLNPVSNATVFKWTASTGEVVAPVKYPLVKPLVTTTYSVLSNPGPCQYAASIIAYAYPYPVVNAGPNVGVCVSTVAQLNATTTGDVFAWTPTTALFNANTLSPIAAPGKTTTYVLTVVDTTGCLKSVSDTIVVTVIPQVVVDAGRDTAILVNQPLQLSATSNTDPQSTTFTWTPATGLDNPNVPDPIATLGYSVDSITYIVRATESHGCYGEDDIKVVVYKIPLPEIFVPTGFTPNGDGKNDVLRPTAVGIASLTYFKVFNRLGQLLFSTSEFGKGWDGTYGGTAQPSGAYVYEVLGLDFLGKPVFRQGTSVLIR